MSPGKTKLSPTMTEKQFDNGYWFAAGATNRELCR